jgi:hypothetical protein
VDLVKGATILAERIAEVKRQREKELEWRPQPADGDPPRCVDCGGAIAADLARRGSPRCDDCRGSATQP